MAGMKAYASPEEWFADAEDWQKPLIDKFRAAILDAAPFEMAIRHGNLFFLHNGQCILIRHDPECVILGFFRGKRLRDLEPRLKASGKYELANIVFREGSQDLPERLGELARKAADLNAQLGDPRDLSNY
ncbi:DUF1801 domain-containing protein [Alteraurantiacibacter aquimixticola]|uniref:DUF1801 domain-containing protein n=1 Tax=Alteraurantiacibacter aquimixticola TaxID=2489173 RepID=A0A4T3F510_9SPHN|nr:DUF1801 domain-containing protein [Alteraurantiacibacter aquimixticola]TIX51921.1 DUF1801 domain-containing protein [Alteraurantiacibacter aquimixticola]